MNIPYMFAPHSLQQKKERIMKERRKPERNYWKCFRRWYNLSIRKDEMEFTVDTPKNLFCALEKLISLQRRQGFSMLLSGSNSSALRAFESSEVLSVWRLEVSNWNAFHILIFIRIYELSSGYGSNLLLTKLHFLNKLKCKFSIKSIASASKVEFLLLAQLSLEWNIPLCIHPKRFNKWNHF